MVLPATLPPARGDMYADSDAGASLGFQLFFDGNLGTGISCAKCHAPESAFTDRLTVSQGKDAGTRNSPTTFNAARLSVFFWDGRADSLWSQPLFPMENPLEMASTRLDVAHFVAANYAASYESVFGALPDMTSWPASGKPGDPAFDGLPAKVQDQVNRVFANVGKAFEAYMRKNTTGVAAFDAFLAGDPSHMIDAAQRGFGVFLTSGCATCHSGPYFTDEKFHKVNFPSLDGAAPDPGQAAGMTILENNPFNLAGPYADPEPGAPPVEPSGPGTYGAFRTPSLRNVASTFPYGHDGALPSLSAVMAIHAPGLKSTDEGNLIAFLQTLNGANPPIPWNNWPSPQ
jgi:cytochrome c peroxidase